MNLTGPWAAYRKHESKAIKFDLEPIGLPFWVQLRNLKVLSPGELHAFSAELQRQHRQYAAGLKAQIETVRNGPLTGEALDAAVDELLQQQSPDILGPLERALIQDWDITDPESGEPMPVPSQDASVLFRLPNEVARYIAAQIDTYLDTLNPAQSPATEAAA